MNQPSHEQFRQVAGRRNQRDTLLTEQKRLQECVRTDAQRAQTLEDTIGEIDKQLHRLEGATLAGVLQSLTGSKHERVDELKSRKWDHEQELQKIAKAFETVSKQLDDIDHLLESFADVEKQYQRCLAAREDAIRAGDADGPQAFLEVDRELETATEDRRRLQSAVEVARTTLQRISTINRSFGRVRKQSIGGPIGIVNRAYKTVQSQTTQPHVERVREGLDNLAQRMKEIDGRDNTHLDDEITRLAVEIASQAQQVNRAWAAGAASDYSATVPIENLVREAIGVLEEKLDDVEKRLKTLNDRKRALLEATE